MNWPECLFYCVAAICVASVLTTIFKGVFEFHEPAGDHPETREEDL
jgi:hypothetical protein